jgi:Protoglobin
VISDESNPLSRRLRLNEQEIAARLVVLGFEQNDAQLLMSLRPWIQRVADQFLQPFYDEQFSHPEFAEIVDRAGSDRERLTDFQRRYLLDLFDGLPDATYVESRLRIGALHAQIGVTPRWYVSSYRLYEKYLFPRVLKHFRFRRRKGRRAVAAISKLLNFDKALVLDMYIEGVTEDVRNQAIGVGLADGSTQADGLLRRIVGLGTERSSHPRYP